jgi:O-antigen/teichoic acid export membrane protein
MSLNFFNRSFYYFFSSFINRGVIFLLLPLYTRILTKVDYGIFELLLVFGSFANIIICVEISQSIYRFYNETNKKKLYSSTAFWFYIFTHLTFIIVALVFSKEISSILFQSENQITIFRLGIFYISLNGIYILLCNQLRLQGLAKIYLNTAIITSIITIITSYIFIYIYKLRLEGVFLSLIFGLLLGAFYSFLKLRNITYIFSFNFKILFKMIKFSFFLLPTSILVITASFLDRYLINYYLSLNEVGIYAVSIRISSLLLFFTIGIQLAYTPFFFKIYKKKNSKAKLGNLINFIFSIYLLGYLFLLLFLPEIFNIFIGKDYEESKYIVKYLALSLVFSQIYVFFPGVMIVNKNYIYFFIYFIVFIINLTLNIYLIPLIGVEGAAVSSLIANSFGAVLNIVCSQLYFKILIKWSKFLVLISLILFFSYLYHFVKIVVFNDFFLRILFFLIAIYIVYIFKLLPKIKKNKNKFTLNY